MILAFRAPLTKSTCACSIERELTGDSTLILGLGSPLRGDDAIGLKVVEALRSQHLPPGTDLVDGGTAGLEIVLELQGHSTVIAIDCAMFGGVPGEVRCFDLLDQELARTDWSAGHAHGLAAAIELSRALGTLPNRMSLFAIEPGSLEYNAQLSEAVGRALPVVIGSILELLAAREGSACRRG